jgi:hypothetical protein
MTTFSMIFGKLLIALTPGEGRERKNSLVPSLYVSEKSAISIMNIKINTTKWI